MATAMAIGELWPWLNAVRQCWCTCTCCRCHPPLAFQPATLSYLTTNDPLPTLTRYVPPPVKAPKTGAIDAFRRWLKIFPDRAILLRAGAR